jgi:hypothetical protein
MADDGLEYTLDTNDISNKSNRKMVLQGTGTQLTNLPVTYPGQIIFCTKTGGSFLIDNYYKRTADNTSWTVGQQTESLEFETPLLVPNNQSFHSVRTYNYITMPNTFDWYLITGFSWGNGTLVGDLISTGADIVNANPPSGTTPTQLVALGQIVTATGTSTIQRTPAVWSRPIKAGTHIGIWGVMGSAVGRIEYTSGQPSQNHQNAAAYSVSPALTHVPAWTATPNRFRYKMHYKGYSNP